LQLNSSRGARSLRVLQDLAGKEQYSALPKSSFCTTFDCCNIITNDRPVVTDIATGRAKLARQHECGRLSRTQLLREWHTTSTTFFAPSFGKSGAPPKGALVTQSVCDSSTLSSVILVHALRQSATICCWRERRRSASDYNPT